MKRHGFTLIELLIVVAILAILAAIIYPIASGNQAKKACQIFHNASGQIIEITTVKPSDWAEKHPYAKVITMSESGNSSSINYRLTVVYEEIVPTPETEK